MSEPDLKCGAYEGRAFLAPDEEEDAVAFVNGQKLFAFDVEALPDVLCSWEL